MRMINLGSANLSQEKDGAGYEEAPKAAHSQLPDYNIGANTWATTVNVGFASLQHGHTTYEPSTKAHEGEDFDMHQLSLLYKF